MMVIIFNQDGSIKDSILSETINQFSHKVNAFQFAIEGLDSSEYLVQSNFELSDKETYSRVAINDTFDFKGTTYNGFKVYLDDIITSVSGQAYFIARCVKQSINEETILFTSRVPFLINKTISNARYELKSDISFEQYQALLEKLSDYVQKYDKHYVRKYQTLQDARNDYKLQVDNIVMVLENGEYVFYKKTLNDFEKVSQRGYEDIVRELATDLMAVGDKIYLSHDTNILTGQEGLDVKTINGYSIFGKGQVPLFRQVSIIGHNGTLSTNDYYTLTNNETRIYDVELDCYFYKIKEDLYFASTLDLNNNSRLWFIKIDKLTRNWVLLSTSLNDNLDIPKAVELSGAKETATNGVLTDLELRELQASDNNYIMFNHEKYYMGDKGHKEGYLTYTHLGFENNVFVFKAITITLSNKSWVLNVKEY